MQIYGNITAWSNLNAIEKINIYIQEPGKIGKSDSL